VKKYNFYLLIIILLSVFLGYTLGSNQNVLFNKYIFSNNNLSKFNILIDYLSKNYVDEINTDSIVGEVIENIIGNLDPHSTYISKKELQLVSERMEGNFVGIGISFLMIRDTVAVVNVLDGGPSKKAGILPGDRILTANNDTLYNKNLKNEEIIANLKGKSKSSVNIRVFRKLKSEFIDFKLIRGEVPIKSVIHYKIKENIGYVKINRFAKTTFDELKKVLISYKKSNEVDKLILDLRDNPGGYLFAAEKILDEFLDEKKIIVITESNSGKKDSVFASKMGVFEKEKVYVLVNGQSASASEVVAGAIQDNDRGLVIGRRTFGKGLVQQQLPLGGGDAIRLTIARYYTPSGRSIQRSYSNGNEVYYQEIKDRYKSGEMISENEIPIIDSLAFKTIGGRLVYGGGGIVPDIYIPSEEKSPEDDWNYFLIRSSIINNFVFSFLDMYREKFNYANTKDFIEKPLDEKNLILEKFKKFCNENKIPIDLKEEIIILNSIKAYIGLQLYNEEVFTQVLNKEDYFMKKTLEIIQN